MRYQNLMKLVVLGGLLASSSFGQTNLADLKAAMPKDLKHPYLHFSSKNLPVIKERVRNNPRARAVFQRLLMEGNRLLDMPVSRQVPPRSRGISPYYQDGRDVYDSYQ